jgi:CRP-like cAMP-binding protein
MFGKIFDELKSRGPLAPAKWEEYISCYHRIEIPSRHVLLKEGEIARRSYFVEKGCLRVWFNNHGKDLTYRFVLENQFVSSAESYRKGNPSLFSIESIEPCIVHWIHKKDLDKILEEMQEIPAFRKDYMNALFERQLDYMNKFLSFIRDSPAERYQRLLEDSPEIIQRVPQHYIASYLGISPVHLSRIRNKIKR